MNAIHYARGYGKLSGMIETMRLADRLGRPDDVRATLDKALAFIASHDGPACDCDDGKVWNNADPTSGQWFECDQCSPVAKVSHQALTQSRAGVR